MSKSGIVTGPTERQIEHAQRLRDELEKAKAGGYCPNGWYAYIDHVWVETLVEGVLGPLPAPPVDRTFTLPNGVVLHNVHDESECEGRGCVLHHPSDHHMKNWPLNWRDGGAFDIKPAHFERICPHGVGHPDPDSMAHMRSIGVDVGTHGCDGCCSTPPLARRHPAPAPESIPRVRRPVRDNPQA